jgi:hypothetical protein
MLFLSSRLDFDHFTRVFLVYFLGVPTQLALAEDIWLPLNLVQLYRTFTQVSLFNKGVSPVFRGNWYQI